MVLAPFKLRCCDIDTVEGYPPQAGYKVTTGTSRHIKRRSEFFKWRSLVHCGRESLQLVAQHDVRARGGDLMKNVKPVGQYRFPVTDALLLNNQVNSLGLAPFL
jgi:kynurenine formamidase